MAKNGKKWQKMAKNGENGENGELKLSTNCNFYVKLFSRRKLEKISGLSFESQLFFVLFKDTNCDVLTGHETGKRKKEG
jgi:hypothetical protein